MWLPSKYSFLAQKTDIEKKQKSSSRFQWFSLPPIKHISNIMIKWRKVVSQIECDVLLNADSVSWGMPALWIGGFYQRDCPVASLQPTTYTFPYTSHISIYASSILMIRRLHLERLSHLQHIHFYFAHILTLWIGDFP